MTGFEEGMNREVWKRGEEVDCDGGKTMGVGGEIQPQDVSFFFFLSFFSVVFCSSASCNCCCITSSWQERRGVGPG